MRSVSSLLTLLVFLVAASRAEADVSKAWAAAKDNLPSNTQALIAIDVGAIVKMASFTKLLTSARTAERDIDEAYNLVKGACKLDPTTAIEGVVIAGDPQKEEGAVYFQLALDRTKASACLESVLKQLAGKKQITVKQEGIYTVASAGNDSVQFAWVGPNVVVMSIDPEKKSMLDAWIGGKKSFAKSTAAELMAKADAKAIAAGAFTLQKPIDRDVPVTTGYAQVTLDKGKLTGLLSGRGADAAGIDKFAAEAKRELEKSMTRDRTPTAIKTILKAVGITAVAGTLTIKGTVSETQLVDAFIAGLTPKKQMEKGGATPPAPPNP